MSSLVYPRIHMGGSAGKELFSQYTDAYHKVREAIQAVRNIDCHARDYVHDDTWRQAWQQYRDHLEALKRVECELMQVALKIMEQLPDE